ncbi:hypothetical protein BKA70DRAFT_1226267 [Coprinopsis sp. MPI-PUGE-AT-0042]|nr:hypothetical protein BKA70DRAFT_1226267 [Coprinopsis sp. MPI-PUGE-AT-0042]
MLLDQDEESKLVANKAKYKSQPSPVARLLFADNLSAEFLASREAKSGTMTVLARQELFKAVHKWFRTKCRRRKGKSHDDEKYGRPLTPEETNALKSVEPGIQAHDAEQESGDEDDDRDGQEFGDEDAGESKNVSKEDEKQKAKGRSHHQQGSLLQRTSQLAFAYFQEATTQAWNGLSTEEKEEYHLRSRLITLRGLPIEEKRRNCHSGLSAATEKFAHFLWNHMGVKAVFSFAFEDMEGDLRILHQDYNEGLGGTSFVDMHRSFLAECGLSNAFLAWSKREFPAEGQDSAPVLPSRQKGAAHALMDLPSDDNGHPLLLNPHQPLVKQEQKWLAQLTRTLITMAYGRALGHPGRATVPWGDLEREPYHYVSPSVIPEHLKGYLKEPSSLSKAKLQALLFHLWNRQSQGLPPMLFIGVKDRDGAIIKPVPIESNQNIVRLEQLARELAAPKASSSDKGIVVGAPEHGANLALIQGKGGEVAMNEPTWGDLEQNGLLTGSAGAKVREPILGKENLQGHPTTQAPYNGTPPQVTPTQNTVWLDTVSDAPYADTPRTSPPPTHTLYHAPPTSWNTARVATDPALYMPNLQAIELMASPEEIPADEGMAMIQLEPGVWSSYGRTSPIPPPPPHAPTLSAAQQLQMGHFNISGRGLTALAMATSQQQTSESQDVCSVPTPVKKTNGKGRRKAKTAQNMAQTPGSTSQTAVVESAPLKQKRAGTVKPTPQPIQRDKRDVKPPARPGMIPY